MVDYQVAYFWEPYAQQYLVSQQGRDIPLPPGVASVKVDGRFPLADHPFSPQTGPALKTWMSHYGFLVRIAVTAVPKSLSFGQQFVQGLSMAPSIFINLASSVLGPVGTTVLNVANDQLQQAMPNYNSIDDSTVQDAFDWAPADDYYDNRDKYMDFRAEYNNYESCRDTYWNLELSNMKNYYRTHGQGDAVFAKGWEEAYKAKWKYPNVNPDWLANPQNPYRPNDTSYFTDSKGNRTPWHQPYPMAPNRGTPCKPPDFYRDDSYNKDFRNVLGGKGLRSRRGLGLLSEGYVSFRVKRGRGLSDYRKSADYKQAYAAYGQYDPDLYQWIDNGPGDYGVYPRSTHE